MEYQQKDPFAFLPPTELIHEEPHFQNNAKYILRLKKELDRAKATIEEQKIYIKDLQSQFLAKDKLIDLLQQM
jgi:hypothetical protein